MGVECGQSAHVAPTAEGFTPLLTRTHQALDLTEACLLLLDRDGSNISRLVERVAPSEIYNLGAQSHVKVSFDVPEYTSQVDGVGAIRLLDAIKDAGLKTRFYQASTSELYGKAQEAPQRETTPFYPRSPYAAAKLYAYWVTVNYREAYGLYACNGILFNHESERRGETFVTRKITRAVARITAGREECLYLGNLDAKRDWGYAPRARQKLGWAPRVTFKELVRRMVEHDMKQEGARPVRG